MRGHFHARTTEALDQMDILQIQHIFIEPQKSKASEPAWTEMFTFIFSLKKYQFSTISEAEKRSATDGRLRLALNVGQLR